MKHIIPSKLPPESFAKVRRDGAAAVEFAIVLPVLLMLLLGAADFGRCFQTSIAMTNAARAGAEYGSMHPFDNSSQGAWQTAVQQAAIDELSGSTMFDVTRLTVTTSSVTESDGLKRISVHTTYPFTTIFNLAYVPATITVSGTAVMRVIR